MALACLLETYLCRVLLVNTYILTWSILGCFCQCSSLAAASGSFCGSSKGNCWWRCKQWVICLLISALGFESGTHACQAGALPLEPLCQPDFECWVFLR
jgi:hypothetical protein